MKAKINNKIVTVKMINANYNDHACEVQMLDGEWKGIYTIVEKADIIEEIKTIKQLETLVRNELKDVTAEELENNNLVELIDTNVYNAIQQFASGYNLTDREYKLLIDENYGKYSRCDTLEDVKVNIVLDVIECRLNNEKATFTNVKKKALDVVKEAYNL